MINVCKINPQIYFLIFSGLGDDEFFPAKSIKITLGQHDLTDKRSNAYNVQVKTIFVHPGYVCKVAKDDIALLELEKEVKWSNGVAPACVAAVKNQNEFDHSHATVAGWGWNAEDLAIGNYFCVIRGIEYYIAVLQLQFRFMEILNRKLLVNTFNSNNTFRKTF